MDIDTLIPTFLIQIEGCSESPCLTARLHPGTRVRLEKLFDSPIRYRIMDHLINRTIWILSYSEPL
jgi:hypothetical protein